MQTTDDIIWEKVNQNLKSGSTGNFKDNRRPVVITNNFPESQNEFRRKTIIPGKKSHSDIVSSEFYKNKNIVVFSNSIGSFICGIRSNFHGGASLKHFPEATSKDLINYINPTLKEDKFDTTVILIGINGMLKNTSGKDILMQNILKIANKLQISWHH